MLLSHDDSFGCENIFQLLADLQSDVLIKKGGKEDLQLDLLGGRCGIACDTTFASMAVLATFVDDLRQRLQSPDGPAGGEGGG